VRPLRLPGRAGRAQHPARTPAIPRPAAASRALSLLLVALLHTLLLFAVLHFMVLTPKTAVRSAPEHLLEMIINTARKPLPQTQPAPRARPAPPLPSRGGVTSGPMPSLAPPAPAPDVTGLGQALFGCAPENIPNLTPDQRAHCTNGFTRPDDNALVQPRSHVQDPARREAEMRAKNTPGHIPCAIVMDTQAPGGGGAAPGVDPICLIGGLINGFRPLNELDK
jgi:hypothetical protein